MMKAPSAMKQMAAPLAKVLIKLDAMSLRERMILLFMFSSIMGWIWLTYYWTPAEQSMRTLIDTSGNIQNRIDVLTATQQAILKRASENPNKPWLEKKSKLEEQLRLRHKELQEALRNLVSPQQMVDVLRHFLRRDSKLRVVEVRTPPPQPLLLDRMAKKRKKRSGSDDADVKLDVPILYVHSLVCELEGEYELVWRYLKNLQGMNWNVYWHTLEYQVQEHPHARIRLHVYTLSLSEDWLSL
jgi:MSHA biogenesis protein MshJ